MPLPKNDPHAKVVGSLNDLVSVHHGSRVEVTFYPKLDTPADILQIFEKIITEDKSFIIYHIQNLDDETKLTYRISANNKEYIYGGPSLEKWQSVFTDYLTKIHCLSQGVCDQFIRWAIQELQKHRDLLKKLKRTKGQYIDLSVTASLRSSQASAQVARTRNVMAYHRDRQNYTLMKFYVGPSTRYAPRSTFASLPKSISNIGVLNPQEQESLTPCEYALEGQGVCIHKGQNMPYVKTFHRAPEGPDSKNARGFLAAWLSWDA